MAELNYDPCDQASFPYQADDPPFDASRLVLEPSSLESAPTLDIFAYLTELVGPNIQSNDPTTPYRCLDMGLRLFKKLTEDSAFNDIAYPDLLAAAMDTAFIWEFG